MSVFTLQPSSMAPPSYSKTKIQPPPYRAKTPTPASSPISAISFNPIQTLKRVFTKSSTVKSTVSIPLSAAKTNTPSTTTSSSTLTTEVPSPSSLSDREQTQPSVLPPIYSPIVSAPRLTSPPAYSPHPKPISGAGTNPSSGTFTTQQQVIPGQSIGLAFNYDAEEWAVMREREDRGHFEESEVAQKEEQGCCAWWWTVGAGPLPWAAYYVF